MLVVFSSWQGSISVFVLDSKPPSPQEDPLRTPLAWGSCAMPETRMEQVVSTSQKSSEGLKSPGPANNSQQHGKNLDMRMHCSMCSVCTRFWLV